MQKATMMRLAIVIGIVFITLTAFAETPAEIKILKISPQDESAVVQTPQGKTQVIKVGDPIGDYGKVIEIVEGRLVIEKKSQGNVETIIIRVEDGEQRIERISRMPDKPPMLIPKLGTDR